MFKIPPWVVEKVVGCHLEKCRFLQVGEIYPFSTSLALSDWQYPEGHGSSVWLEISYDLNVDKGRGTKKGLEINTLNGKFSRGRFSSERSNFFLRMVRFVLLTVLFSEWQPFAAHLWYLQCIFETIWFSEDAMLDTQKTSTDWKCMLQPS